LLAGCRPLVVLIVAVTAVTPIDHAVSGAHPATHPGMGGS